LPIEAAKFELNLVCLALRNPSSTIRIFSSAENRRRVLRRMTASPDSVPRIAEPDSTVPRDEIAGVELYRDTALDEDAALHRGHVDELLSQLAGLGLRAGAVANREDSLLELEEGHIGR